jgi:uncharacterized protein
MHVITVHDQELILHHQKALYWQQEKTLVVADFHIGKSAHFRRNGIPVHSGIDQVNIKNLFAILKAFKAEHLVFLGDLFHNKVNGEWKDLKNFLSNYKSLPITLVLGNHDILTEDFYSILDIRLVPGTMHCPPFVFSHKPMELICPASYNLAGHVHPGIIMRGKGKQQERLPCFYFNDCLGILPAFGEFTGLHILRPKKNDRVFIVTNKGVFDV